jgi:protease-4
MPLLRLLGFVFDLLLLPLRALRGRRVVPKGTFLTLAIDGGVVDILPARRFWEFREDKRVSLDELRETIDFFVVDPDVRGLLVTLTSLRAGISTCVALRDLLARARAAGKEVVVYLPRGGGTQEVLVATAASKVLLGPTTQLVALGFASHTRYVKSALDKAGIKPEIYACGEYKSAGESLVRDSMSDAQREQLGKLLDAFDNALVTAISDGRAVPRERARELVDGGPYFGQAAVDAGLADGIAYADEVPGLLGLPPAKRPGPFSKGFTPAAYYLVRRKKPRVRALRRGSIVAVIPVHGAIAHAGAPFGTFATDEALTQRVRAARLNKRVAGVILHIDSPGGSALASDVMHHEIEQLAREKPVVACMANVAASGGYYVAAPAHKIVCGRASITGSIGVVSARLTLGPLLSKLGVTVETVQRGARAGLLSASAPLSEDERGALSRELDATYAAFIGVVARGRKRSAEEIEQLARGRVYSGEDALAVGLVDVLGGFDVAMRELRALMPKEALNATPHVVRQHRNPVPPLELPSPESPHEHAAAYKRALWDLLLALTPRSEHALVSLALTGETNLTLWTAGSIDTSGA